MTLAEAVALFEQAGLQVSTGPDGFVAAADPHEPPAVLKDQGVASVFDFGFSARMVDTTWFFRHERPPKPAEQYATLDEVVSRGLELLERYRADTSRS